MLIFLIISSFIIASLAIIFALQNADIILVNFLFWDFEGSLALVLLLTFIMGALSSLLVMLYWMIKKDIKIRRIKREKEKEVGGSERESLRNDFQA